MLEVNHLVKSFGSKKAVDDLNIKMDRPGVFGLIGTNGAGKTTAIRCILGLMRPDQGTSEWNGKTIERNTLSFGYMPEERGIYMKTKVMEQLIYFGILRGMSKEDAKNSALNYMDRLQVMQYKDMAAEKLSKGNQQKIQLISTLIHNPKLIFLDEPFSGLDPVNANVLRNLIEELVKEEKYIIMSSHQMETVEDYCNKIILLHQGKTLLNGDLREIKNGYGHTNLVVSAGVPIDRQAEECGLVLIEKRADETEYKIAGLDMAEKFMRRIIESGVYPIKYVVTQPSLHEIFVEKVGEQA